MDITDLQSDGAQDTKKMSTEPLFKVQQSEADFQAAVMQLATTLGWEWMHIRPGLNERGYYRTPVSGSLGAGWPDLVLVKGEAMIFAELKSEKGRMRPTQQYVMAVLAESGHKVYVWRPSDWDRIVETLTYTLTSQLRSFEEVSPK